MSEYTEFDFAEDGNNQLTPKQKKILQAAIEMFAEKGYASTSTSEIAKKAGVAEGTIFRHYKTKKDLLLSIVTPMVTKIAFPFFAKQFVKEIFTEKYDDFEVLLRKLLNNRFEFVKQNTPLLKIILQEMAFHPEIQEQFKRVFEQKVFPHFKEIIIYFQGRGQLPEIPAETIIRMIMTNAIGYMITRYIVLPDREWDDEQELEQTITFILNGLKK